MSIAIVTDSTADIPQKLAQKLGIDVIPTIVVMGDQSYEDGHGFTRQEFYERLPEMSPLPTTASPSAGTFEKHYQQIFDRGFQSVISIHVSSQLSGVYNTACLAAQSFGERIHVVDGESLSLGFGFQVITAAEAVARNLDLAQIMAQIKSTRQRTRMFAMLDTLEYIHRSGRVGWARARIGSLLRIKPFVEVRAGQVSSQGQARTRRKGIAHLRELLHGLGELERLSILHTNAPEDAQAFLAALDLHLPTEPFIVNVTTVIGTHVGPNALGFAAVLKGVPGNHHSDE